MDHEHAAHVHDGGRRDARLHPWRCLGDAPARRPRPRLDRVDGRRACHLRGVRRGGARLHPLRRPRDARASHAPAFFHVQHKQLRAHVHRHALKRYGHRDRPLPHRRPQRLRRTTLHRHERQSHVRPRRNQPVRNRHGADAIPSRLQVPDRQLALLPLRDHRRGRLPGHQRDAHPHHRHERAFERRLRRKEPHDPIRRIHSRRQRLRQQRLHVRLQQRLLRRRRAATVFPACRRPAAHDAQHERQGERRRLRVPPAPLQQHIRLRQPLRLQQRQPRQHQPLCLHGGLRDGYRQQGQHVQELYLPRNERRQQRRRRQSLGTWHQIPPLDAEVQHRHRQPRLRRPHRRASGLQLHRPPPQRLRQQRQRRVGRQERRRPRPGRRYRRARQARHRRRPGHPRKGQRILRLRGVQRARHLLLRDAHQLLGLAHLQLRQRLERPHLQGHDFRHRLRPPSTSPARAAQSRTSPATRLAPPPSPRRTSPP